MVTGTNGVDAEKITILVNGLTDREHLRPSRTQVVTSLRRHLPGARIHLVTRRPIEHDEATLFAEITRVTVRDDQEALLEALARVRTEFTLVFGNDRVLRSSHFLNRWPGRRRRERRFELFRDRIMVLGASIREPGQPTPGDPRARDRFEFGRTEDLVKLKALQILNTAPGSIEADVARAHWRQMLAHNFVLVSEDRAGLDRPQMGARGTVAKPAALLAKVHGWLGRPLQSS